MIAVNWGAATDVGKIRQVNEDNLVANGQVFVVADGMGGHAAGDVASGLAVEVFGSLDEDGSPLRPDTVLDAVTRANESILTVARQGEGRGGMGTTVVGLVAVCDSGDDYWFAFNIGDSRLYRSMNGELEQVSVDHSLVQELYEAGAITGEQRRDHPRANVVTRVLGTDPTPMPDYWLRTPQRGERYLLCSDGLSNEVTDTTLAATLAAGADAESTAQRLVELALTAGGRDNITAIVVDVQ
jgi:serine/threonine protein phosphatase PrpC